MDKKASKIKVLFVITKSNWGGAQKYVYDLATGLPKDEFDVAVVLGGNGILIEKLNNAGIRTIPLSALVRDVNASQDFSSFLALLKIFRTEKPDVVHLNSAKVSGLGAGAARLAGIQNIIFTAHGWAFNEDRSLLARTIIKFLSWLTVMLSHRTIAVSNAVKKDIDNWPFIDEKIVVIRNGIKVPDFLERLSARNELISKTKWALSQDAFIIGTVAELHKNKGLVYAIEAFAKIASQNPSLYYFILGDGEERSALDRSIRQHQLEGRIFLLGFVEDAARFMPAFDIFLLPSLTEALGLVLLEAGFAGIPVVATRVGGIPEIIKNNETGILVPPRDPVATAEAIKKLFELPELRIKIGTELKEKVLQEFLLKRVVSEAINVYSLK